jgi:hypothetical protein
MPMMAESKGVHWGYATNGCPGAMSGLGVSDQGTYNFGPS